MLQGNPDRFHNSLFATTLQAAIYQRWAELDIDTALTHIANSADSRDGSYIPQAMQAISLLAALEPDYVKQWLTDYAPNTSVLLEAAWSGIASNDPETFVREYLTSANNNADHHEHYGALHSAVIQWAEKDPRAALSFIHTEANESIFDSLEEPIIYTWMQQDPAAALSEIETLLNDPNTNEVNRRILTDLYIQETAKADPNSALQWALAQSDPANQDDAVMNILYNWDNNDPAELQGFIDQLPTEQRDRLLPMAAPMITSNMARTDPTAAVEWAEQLPEVHKNNAIAGIIDRWADTDPGSAINWLGNLPDTPDNQMLMYSAASSVIHRDPSLATDIFIKLPQNMQAELVEQVVVSFADHQGQDTARDWLSQRSDPTVQQIGAIALDSLDPDIDAISLLDRIGSLQTNHRVNLLYRTISQRAYTDNEAVTQWVINTPLLSEDERREMQYMTQSINSYPTGAGSADFYYNRR